MNPLASEVQSLFNRKACLWQAKYQPGGKLNFRRRQFIERLSELCPPPGSVLDLGCGTGDISSAICRRGYGVTACDIAENMLEKARSTGIEGPVRYVLLEADWVTLPFLRGTFDAVVASSVFEYLMDTETVVQELSRVLRPGGVLIVSVPNPYNRIRKLEARLCSTGLVTALWLLFSKTPRVGPYLAYLHLSRNRFQGDRWESLLTAAGFVPFDKDDFSRGNWSRNASIASIVLAVKKASSGQSEAA